MLFCVRNDLRRLDTEPQKHPSFVNAPEHVPRHLQQPHKRRTLRRCTLMCQGRPFYPNVLAQMALYIRNDLRRLDTDPVELIGRKPDDDPLEKIMYLTSVSRGGSVPVGC